MNNQIATIARDKVNNDLFVGPNGSLAMVFGKDAYSQIIDAKMKTALGELQLDTSKGIPYFETVFSRADLAEIWEAEVRKMIESLSFVVKIISFDYDIQNNMIQYTIEIQTDEGLVVSNG